MQTANIHSRRRKVQLTKEVRICSTITCLDTGEKINVIIVYISINVRSVKGRQAPASSPLINSRADLQIVRSYLE